jgi:hypothetical protein
MLIGIAVDLSGSAKGQDFAANTAGAFHFEPVHKYKNAHLTRSGITLFPKTAFRSIVMVLSNTILAQGSLIQLYLRNGLFRVNVGNFAPDLVARQNHRGRCCGAPT